MDSGKCDLKMFSDTKFVISYAKTCLETIRRNDRDRRKKIRDNQFIVGDVLCVAVPDRTLNQNSAEHAFRWIKISLFFGFKFFTRQIKSMYEYKQKMLSHAFIEPT